MTTHERRSVSISDLKANLSRHLGEVRRGREIEILNRGRPVARLVPAAGSGDRDRERLVARGFLRPGRGGAAALLRKPLVEIPGNLLRALDDDRDDRV